jgi:hypothetical protein
MANLSAALKNEKRRNDGAVCSGAGSGEDFITEVRPPGSMKVIWSYQRIWSATPMRS